MYRPVSPQPNLPLLEEGLLNFWRLHRVLPKLDAYRSGGPQFVCCARPPSAHRKPGLEQARGRAFGDAFLRYKTMRGYHASRRDGWDTHGLALEVAVERGAGLGHKSQVEASGVARFNDLCRQAAFEHLRDWERFYDRLGYWVDLGEASVSYTDDYIESEWWAFKTLWERGLLSQVYRAAPYCPRCGTPLSALEAALDRRRVSEPAVYLRLPLVDEPGVSLLAWSRSPWTLPGCVAVAAVPEMEYVIVRRGLVEGGSERLILARQQLETVFGDERVAVVDSFDGRKLKGRHYRPLFTFLHPEGDAHYVVLRDDLHIADGSGLSPLVPAFDAAGLQAALDADLPVLAAVAGDGTFIPQVRPWSGKFVKYATPFIVDDLERRGLLLRAGIYEGESAFCPYCQTPLLHYACNAWYLRTAQAGEKLAAAAQQADFSPLQAKRSFGDLLSGAGDWALSRGRYWGAPLPVWECTVCHHQVVVASRAELSQLAGRDLSGLDLHRPALDGVVFPCPECPPAGGGEMQRLPDTLDAAFDAGVMPLAGWHFPYGDREAFRAHFPAGLVIDDGDGWFYALHAVSTLLFGSPAGEVVLHLDLPLADEADPWELFNRSGADALRWSLYTPLPAPGNDGGTSLELAGRAAGVVQGFIQPLWDVYAFFVAFANLDAWQPDGLAAQEAGLTHRSAPTAQESVPSEGGAADEGTGARLDGWLRSELHSLVSEVTHSLDGYDVGRAAGNIQEFVDRLSWYLRRVRRRFWEGGDPSARGAALAILYDALLTLSKLLAPAMPFLSEALYQNLARSADAAGQPESVHLCDWPGFDESLIDPHLNQALNLVRRLAGLGRTARQQAGIKASQPLPEAMFTVESEREALWLQGFAGLLADELNVKRVHLVYSPGDDAPPGQASSVEGAYRVSLSTALTQALQNEALAHEFVHRVQELRRQGGLEAADHACLLVEGTPNLMQAIRAYRDVVSGETRSAEAASTTPPQDAQRTEAWFGGEWVKITLWKLQ